VDGVVAALAAQHDELSGILGDLGEDDWHRPTRCEGWDIRDVVLHLAQTDELAIASATGTFSAVLSRLTDGARPAASVDDAVAAMVDRERETPALSVGRRWSEAAHELVARLDAGDLSKRVQWVAGELSLRTLATTITGPAGDLCAVAARRVEPSTTSLVGEGPDAHAVLALVQTYA
jgi:uncharacterized protein (TIGR03083 family)